MAIRMAISPRFAIRQLLKEGDEEVAVVKCLERMARRLEERVDIFRNKNERTSSYISISIWVYLISN